MPRSRLEDIPFREEAAQPMKHGERPLAPLGCLDRVYDFPSCSGKTMLEDFMLNRAITVERDHASSVIVWNPGQQGADNMADLGAKSWNKFLCIETGNAAPRFHFPCSRTNPYPLSENFRKAYGGRIVPLVKTADNITSQVSVPRPLFVGFPEFSLSSLPLGPPPKEEKLTQAREEAPHPVPAKGKKPAEEHQ